MSQLKDERKYINKVKSFNKKFKVTIFIVGIFVFGTSMLSGSFDIVEAGYVKIAVEPTGEIKIAERGWNFFWCNPLSTKYDFQINTQVFSSENLHADTLDGHVNIDLSVSYFISKENVTDLFLKYSADYSSIVKAIIESAFRDAFSNNSMVSCAITNRNDIQEKCKDTIDHSLKDMFITMVDLKVQNILLPTAYSNAQIQTQINYELWRAANISREIQLLEATTAADVSIITASALANATIIRANSTAESLEIIIQHLNVTGNITEDHLLSYLFIQQLTEFASYGNVILITDGNSPFVVVPNNE